MSTNEPQNNSTDHRAAAELPVIDLCGSQSDIKTREFQGQQLGSALQQVGFAAVTGHGIDAGLIQRMREQTVRLFALPESEKMALRVSPENYRGYIPLGFFTPNRGAAEADQYEGYKLHQEVAADDPICDASPLYGPNKWPQSMPQLNIVVADYWQACEELGTRLLTLICAYLALEPSVILQAMTQPLNNMTLLHYPPRSSAGEIGIHPHKDTDVLTILAPDAAGGLFVRSRDCNHWIEAITPPGALLINVGDMLELWSGGRLVSTPHKVVNKRGAERYSFPFFMVPRYDVVIRPLVATPQFAGRQMHVGDVSTQIWYSNWPDAAAIDASLDPYITN
ncbi:MAG: isopenicillin N synthase family oxygenase [Gammaproteobacteria bacterium]|nr:isopenicillin N synthase family oxygenase [Gammaproteobacteria bacterium]